MERTLWSDFARELLVPRGPLAWAARLVVWCGCVFVSFFALRHVFGLPVHAATDFVVVALSCAPVIILAMLVHRQTEASLNIMTHAALTDPLTGLMNRRAFHKAVELAGPGAVLVIDIDHFKYVNDRHGHAVGDEVLRAMSEHLRRNIRNNDKIARLGGEEFAVYLPNCDSMEIDGIGERLCSGFVVYNDRVPVPVKVTMSVGAAYSQMSSSTERLIRNADQALYQAKRSGRACLAFWQPPVTSRY